MKDSVPLRNLSEIISVLPELPGVYQYFNEKNEIIYVGKAKNLKKRVSSYFQKTHLENSKLRVLVNKIADFQYIVVETESDALLLENNLIKKYQPRYNILLKDDKTYPWICVKNESFPRVFQTRNVVKDGSFYFGPYTSITMVRTILDLIRNIFQLRSCSLNLSNDLIETRKYKVCLEFHMGNCKAPCIGEQSDDEYNMSIIQIKDILKGNINQVLVYLKEKMKVFADELSFENAEMIRQKILILEKYQSKTVIVNPSINNIDVFSYVEDKNCVVINFIKVMNGSIIQSHTVEIIKKLDESKEELLAYAIIDIRDRFSSESKELILPFQINENIPNTIVNIPKVGDKKKLLDLSERNAKYYILERQKNSEKANPENRFLRIMETLQKDLHLSDLPIHIECFDNSNIQGTNPVSSCIVFNNARPAKSEYRHFNVKSVEGPNDFASMEEVIFRRYNRLIDEKKPLPQLIIVDGGKGQLSSAVDSLTKLNIYGKVAIIGIAKRLEEIYFPNDSVPLYLDKQSESLRLIQQMRDEAHRFGITFHRLKRSNDMTKSAFDTLKGIGPKTKEMLLTKYGAISGIKSASVDELSVLIGKSKAEIIAKFFEKSV